MHRPDPDEAARFVDRSNFLWYQRFELADGVWTPGVRDVRVALEACNAQDDMTGLAVLDIGTTNGGVAFEAVASRRGNDHRDRHLPV